MNKVREKYRKETIEKQVKRCEGNVGFVGERRQKKGACKNKHSEHYQQVVGIITDNIS